jgi:NhaP-type Na+/H+ or K+/H+ antiporter
VWTIALSIVVHGMSATPLMAWHQSRRTRRGAGRT